MKKILVSLTILLQALERKYVVCLGKWQEYHLLSLEQSTTEWLEMNLESSTDFIFIWFQKRLMNDLFRTPLSLGSIEWPL